MIFSGFSQNIQDNNWVFGSTSNAYNINFSDLTTPVFSSLGNYSGADFFEGVASVSDQNGNLILFSDGRRLWRRNNGTDTLLTSSLNGNPSSSQNVIFVPRPGNPSRYYVVNINGATSGNCVPSTNPNNMCATLGKYSAGLGLYYTEIDINTGIVAGTLNTVLYTNSTINFPSNAPINAVFGNKSETVTATTHNNGLDYWVVAQIQNEARGGNVFSYKVTCSGFVNNGRPTATTPLSIIGSSGVALSLKVTNILGTPNQKIAIASEDGIYVGTFNSLTGATNFGSPVTNPNNLIPNGLGNYSVELSPSGNAVYSIDYNGSLSGYNLMTSPPTQFVNQPESQSGIQLARDGKIYSGGGTVINAPDNLASPDLTSTSPISGYGIPQHVPWQLNPSTVSFIAQNDIFNFCNTTTTTTSTTNVLQANPTTLDTYNGNPITSLTGYSLTQVGALTPTPAAGGITLNANGTITVNAGTTAGNYSLSYQLCSNSCACSNVATVTVNVGASITLVAFDDVLEKSCPISSKYKPSVLYSNPEAIGTPDTYNGVGFDVLTDPDEVYTVVQVSSDSPLVNINASGTLVLTQPLNAGVYHLSYYITATTPCGTSQSNVANVTFTFTAPPAQTLVANPDFYCFTTAGGVSTTTVLVNDTVGSNTATFSSVAISDIVGSTPNISLSATTGKITVAPGTPAGSYSLNYSICQKCLYDNCSSTRVVVNVKGIQANNDNITLYNDGSIVSSTSGGMNILGNDNYYCLNNGTPVITVTTSNPNFTIDASGTLIPVTTLLAEGTYTLVYQICESGNPGLCSSATVTITVIGLSSGTRANSVIKTTNLISGSGDIIISGEFSAYSGTNRNRLAKLNSSLSNVGAFGATTNFGPAHASITADLIRSVLIDGSDIYVGGRFTSFNNQINKNRLVKLNLSDGSLQSFSANFNNSLHDVKKQASTGKLIVAGTFLTYTTTSSQVISTRRIARINTNGDLDQTFNPDNGQVMGANGSVFRIGFQSTGNIIVTGGFTTYSGFGGLGGIMRLTSDGLFDSSFTSGSGFGITSPYVTEGSFSFVNKMHIDSSNRIYMVGNFNYPVSASSNNGVATAGNIVRLNANGSIDYTFNYGKAGADNRITDIIPTSTAACSNCFYLTGSFTSYNGTPLNTKSRLIRIQQNGDIDTGFNALGNDFSLPFITIPITVYSANLQPDGKLLLAGDFTKYNNIAVNGITRIIPITGAQSKEEEEQITLLEQNGFALYPNPSSGIINLRFKETLSERTNVEIYNALGQKVWTTTINGNNEFILDLPNAASGVYMVKISNSKINSSKSIIRK